MYHIAIYIPWFSPAYKAGGPIQSILNLVTYNKFDFSYDIITSNKDVDGSEIAVKADKWVRFDTNIKVCYSSGGNSSIVPTEKYDIAFINGIYSWDFNLKPIFKNHASRKIVAVRGMLHPGALSQKNFKKKLYLLFWKLFRIHRKVEFHASTVEEKAYIQKVFGKNIKIHIAANFPRKFKRQVVRDKAKGSLDIVTIGLISPMKNHLLIVKALKEIGQQTNEALNLNYHIFGPVKDDVYWEQCKELVQHLPSNILVHYYGDLHPMKVEEALKNGHVFILPSKSENFGHAIYEALSAGKPVITSHGTPWNGLEDANAGMNVNPENIEALANAILRFAYMDSAELEEWSKGAKTYSEKAINIEEIEQQYKRMFGLPN
jgi:glycosyltransferase involved in cell wall biosynthesis